MVISHPAEKLAILRDSVMNLSRHLDSHAFLLLYETKDVSLGFLNIGRQPSNLDPALTAALPWNIDRNSKFRLKILLRIPPPSNQGAMLVCWDLDYFCSLTVSLSNDLLYRCDNVVNNILLAFDLN